MPKLKPTIYLDTSVISAYDDSRIPQRQAQTQEFWKILKDFKVYVSEVTIKEINNHPNIRKRNKLLKLTANLTVLSISDKAKELAQEYLKKEIIPVRYIDDALHLSIATIHKCDILVSWNCKHLINIKTKRGANKINLAMGYKEIELVEPPMVKL